MTIRTAVAKSVNAVAVRVIDELTPRAAYDFLTEQLDFSHLNAADIDLAPMALGGMNGGVTVREMAAGFSIFLNDGIFNGARTYTKVLNSDGTVLLENEPLGRQVFEREQTVYYMRDVLMGVTSSEMGGTGRRINVPGMDTAGKTGTSQKKRDLWFCGFTPYYVGATWFGYDSNYDLSGVSGNPSLTVWNKVMNKIHENLESAKFDLGDNENFERASYCTVSGLSPSSSCRANGTVETGRYWKGDAPDGICTTCRYHEPEPGPEEEPDGTTDPENPDGTEPGGNGEGQGGAAPVAPSEPSGTGDPENG